MDDTRSITRSINPIEPLFYLSYLHLVTRLWLLLMIYIFIMIYCHSWFYIFYTRDESFSNVRTYPPSIINYLYFYHWMVFHRVLLSLENLQLIYSKTVPSLLKLTPPVPFEVIPRFRTYPWVSVQIFSSLPLNPSFLFTPPRDLRVHILEKNF